ncbi:MAG: L-2-hydroxyglutarate oxidase [Methylococcales bacterium]|jgi:(S)-2-hydroxyglutarate dehydrogenase|nr:L-2-hydroxyglutarate oxidase [Methylococcales bacterium]MBT7411071.1 L-2-hydroxyglutarate oxidase [Methylococcales bacterium]
MKKNFDILIIGSGIIGMTLAIELKKLFSDSQIAILEKESQIAQHASGRNSGVLHAGFYYSADSLKAKFTRDGNIAMRDYCQQKNLKINQCGKLVVTKNEAELTGLKELQRRATANNVHLDWIDEKQAQDIEPNVKTHQNALWSPNTATVDPKEIMNSLRQDVQAMGITLLKNTLYVGKIKNKNAITTNQGTFEASYIINTAGLYADKIANDFNFSEHYRILPFKGLYLYSNNNKTKLNTNIYPVPNLEHPFLGVHFTLTVDGLAKIGPTAIPAFWREHYQGFDRFNFSEFLEVIGRESRLFINNKFNFRQLAYTEVKKYYRPHMIAEAEKLLQNTKQMQFNQWGKPGIRAQLINTKDYSLEMDFKFEGDNKSFHVLNAVSPAFTCSIPFSQYLAKKIQGLIG